MTRLRLRYAGALLAASLTAVLLAGTATAQGAAENDGALFLLLPVGARSASMGQAVAASATGGESVWLNPGGVANSTRAEVLLHHSQSIIGTGDAATLVIPFKVIGVFALSASMHNFGEQELSDSQGALIGLLVPRSFVFAASYATPLIGNWLNAGLTYKLIQIRADCSGACDGTESFGGSSSAVDFGLQFPGSDARPLALGLAIRNVGPSFQIVDNPQADALPSRLHLGADLRIAKWGSAERDGRLHVSAELVDRIRVTRPSVRIGSELRYQERFFLRGGYMFEEGAGASIGGGIVAGSLVIDIGRQLAGLSADIGEPPTFLSLKFRFR